MSFGTELDKYLEEYPDYETVYIFFDRQGNEHVITTQGVTDYDYTEVFSEDNNLRYDIELKKKEVAQLQAKIRTLNKDKRAVENAIKKIANYTSK